MDLVLKFYYRGQLHDIPFCSMPDYGNIVTALKAWWPMDEPCALKYPDEEGDLCTLVEATFADFLTMIQTTSSGQKELYLEAVPGPDTTPTSKTLPPPSTRSLNKKNLRCHEYLLKLESVQERDLRDLDELLEQFEDPVSSKKQKKKKKKSKKPQVDEDSWEQTLDAEVLAKAGEEKIEADEEEKCIDLSLYEHFMSPKEMLAHTQDGAVILEDTAEISTMVMKIEHAGSQLGLQCTQDAQDNHAFGQFGLAEVSVDPTTYNATRDGDPDTDGDGSCDMHRSDGADALDAERFDAESDAGSMAGDTLRRASSCPCLSTWQASQDENGEVEGGSLVANAWPFVNPEKVCVNFGTSLMDQGVAGQFNTQPSQLSRFGRATDKTSCDLESQLAHPEFTEQARSPSPTPCIYNYPQIVWMPVLMWAAAEHASVLPGPAPPMACAAGMEAGR